MSLVHCSGPEATEVRWDILGAESDRPSWREARNDHSMNRREREMSEECGREMRSDPVWLAIFDRC